MWTTVTVKKENSVSHNIYICTANNKQTIDLISAAILGMGIKTSPAANDGSLFHPKSGSATTMLAIKVDNFNTKLSKSGLLDRICKAIDKYTYFGIVIKDNEDGSTSWRGGNTEFKPEHQATDIEPKTTDAPLRIDLKTVAKLIKATVNMSDIFFDDIPQADRRLLARELEKLCEDPNASFLTVPKE